MPRIKLLCDDWIHHHKLFHLHKQRVPVLNSCLCDRIIVLLAFLSFFCLAFLLLFQAYLIISMVGNHRPGYWGPKCAWRVGEHYTPLLHWTDLSLDFLHKTTTGAGVPVCRKCLSGLPSLRLPHRLLIQQQKCIMKEQIKDTLLSLVEADDLNVLQPCFGTIWPQHFVPPFVICGKVFEKRSKFISVINHQLSTSNVLLKCVSEWNFTDCAFYCVLALLWPYYVC